MTPLRTHVTTHPYTKIAATDTKHARTHTRKRTHTYTHSLTHTNTRTHTHTQRDRNMRLLQLVGFFWHKCPTPTGLVFTSKMQTHLPNHGTQHEVCGENTTNLEIYNRYYQTTACIVLQCDAACCSVLQCKAVWCSVMQCDAVCCRVLQCVAECCSVMQCIAV